MEVFMYFDLRGRISTQCNESKRWQSIRYIIIYI